MIDLRDSTVLVNNVEEYIAVTKIAKKQGFTWASGQSLDFMFCVSFPTRLRFDSCREVHYNATAYLYYSRDYSCKDVVSNLRNLILKRKEGQYVKREIIY